MTQVVAEGRDLPAELRERLEDALAEAGRRIGVNLGVGNARVVIALQDGRVRWVEPTLEKVPPSRFAAEPDDV